MKTPMRFVGQWLLVVILGAAVLVWVPRLSVGGQTAVPLTTALLQMQGTNTNVSVVATCGIPPRGFPANAGVRAPLTIDHLGNLCTTGGTGGGGGSTGPVTALGCYIKNGSGTTADTTNFGVCKSSAGIFVGIRAIKTSTAKAFVKMYNSATPPNCASANGFMESIPIPDTPEAAGFIDPSINIPYPTGVAWCVTGGTGAPTDNTAAPAGVFVTIRYN